jgi:hypothetical protein
MPRKPGPPCSVCKAPSVAKGFCDKHYRRWSKFGNTTATLRPDDWGKREKHPLYGQWAWMNRSDGRVERWDDFWLFIEDVGERPTAAHRLYRVRPSEPWGPNNSYWKETLQGRHYTLKTADGKKEYQRVWRANNRLKAKDNDLKKTYGITLADYDAMLEKQDGKCAICRSEETRAFKTLCVDHCHAEGHVRGLLCSSCNSGLGRFKDDPAALRRAAAYLERETILRA